MRFESSLSVGVLPVSTSAFSGRCSGFVSGTSVVAGTT